MAHHSTLLTKLQRCSHSADATCNKNKPHNRRTNCGRKGDNVQIYKANESSSTPSSLLTASDARASPTAMPIWHQQYTNIAQSYTTPSSTTTIDDELSCSFCPGVNHPMTHFPAIRPQIRAMFINMRGMNLLILPRRLQWVLPNVKRGSSPLRGGDSTQNTLQVFSAANSFWCSRCFSHRIDHALMRPRCNWRRKTKIEGQTDGKLRTDTPST